MENKIKDRNNVDYNNKESRINLFLYNTYIGRIILKVLVLPIISKIVGVYQSTFLSTLSIKSFIKKNNINMDDYEDKKYKSFNDFFARKIKENRRVINYDKNALISPCDSKLSVYKIDDDNVFRIKNSYYTVNDLVNTDLKDKYKNGYALVFRLCVDDYHRYSYIDDGVQSTNNHIKGFLHTVIPIAVDNINVFSQNEREWTILHTKNFGDVIEIEVGALMVGKIVNLKESNKFKRGEEKGYFKFGASTIVLLINDVKIDDDILENSKNGIETIVKLGEKIGNKQ